VEVLGAVTDLGALVGLLVEPDAEPAPPAGQVWLGWLTPGLGRVAHRARGRSS
jgi:hypothetical protein